MGLSSQFFPFFLGILVDVLMRLLFSVMSFVGYDYRKERKGVVDDGNDDDDDSLLENFDDENDNITSSL